MRRFHKQLDSETRRGGDRFTALRVFRVVTVQPLLGSLSEFEAPHSPPPHEMRGFLYALDPPPSS